MEVIYMFAEERIEEIISLLNQNGKVVVKELSKTFNVTEDCIRKDLKTLVDHGLIKRTYGGAVLQRKASHNSAIITRKTENIDAKKNAAKKAYKVIEDRETVFLDISSTNIYLAQEIANGSKRITVVTNMMDVIQVFSSVNHITVIGIGGVFNNELNGFIGSSTIESISRYKVDRAFIGTCGIDLSDQSIATFLVEDGNTKHAIINASKKNYIITNSNIFYQDGVYKFATLLDISAIIVDAHPSAPIIKTLNKLSVELI